MNSQLQQEIVNCIRVIRQGGYIIFPDETGWSVGCDIGNVENVKALTGDDSNCTILLDDFSRMHKYCSDLPETAADLAQYSNRPIAFLFKNALNVPGAMVNSENFTKFRIVKEEFVKTLINKCYGSTGKPLVARLLPEQEQPQPMNEYLHKPAYIVNLRRSPKVNEDSLVIVQLEAGGQIKFIQK